MKALLIDDERLARNELRRLLEAFPEIEVGDDRKESYMIPHNSPCFSPGLWWASSAAAAGLCLTVEDKTDSSSP